MTDPEAFTAILAADECADWIASAHLKTTDDSPHHFSDADCPEMTGFTGGVAFHAEANSPRETQDHV